MANFFPLVANYSANIANGFVGNRIEELRPGDYLDFDQSGIINLDVTRLEILGGSFGQVLSTDGNGVLSWVSGGGGGTVRPIIEWTTPANANNQTFTAPNVAAFAGNTYAAVYVNGVLQRTSDYTIVGNVLTVNQYLTTDDVVAIGPTGGGGAGSGTVTEILTTQVDPSNLGFTLTGGPITSNGTITLTVPNANVFTNALALGNVAYINLNGNANTYLNGNGMWTVPNAAAGPNLSVQYNLNGNLTGSNNFTFNGNNVSTTNVFEKVTYPIGSVLDLSQSAYFSATLTTPTTFTLASIPAAPQVGSFILHLSNTATNPPTFSFSTNPIKWVDGIAPTLSSNATSTDILGFYSLDSGINWFGYVLGQDVA